VLHSAPISPGCDAGDAQDCLRVARAAIDGGSLAQDPFRAVAAAGRGCDLGLAQACATLAWVLDGRAGPASDPPLLVRAAERGCDLGSGDACSQAGFALAYGKPGVPRDPARAEMLAGRACADGGQPRACAVLGDLLAKRGDVDRARATLSGCCTAGDGGCCTARDRLAGGR
jgi:TPR repeat protein